ncbi:MAG: RNA polymerase sigma factor [bacterium]|nr:RNA polymerase sigma factor [bacterium]
MIQNEQEIISAAVRGNHQAFNQLVIEYQEQALMLALRLLRNQKDAEDVVQNAFIKIWEELSTFRGESKFSSWLYRIVYNMSLNKLKSRAIRNFLRIQEDYDEEDFETITLVNPDDNPEQKLIEKEKKERLEQAIRKLSMKQRTIFIMRVEQGLSNAEIAEITGKSEGSVKANLSFALAKLKKLLEE